MTARKDTKRRRGRYRQMNTKHDMFDTMSYNFLVMKLRKYGIDMWTVRWIEIWLTVKAQRVVSNTEFGGM